MDEWNDLLEEETAKEQPPTYKHSNSTHTQNTELPKQENPPLDQKPSLQAEKPFRSVLTFQVILCLIIAICMVLLNAFFPKEYTNLDNALKAEFARPLYVEEGVGSVWNEVSGFLENLRPLKPQNGDITDNTTLLYRSNMK